MEENNNEEGEDFKYDHLIKVGIYGEGSVGKTSLLRQFTSGRFEEKAVSTIGLDFMDKEMTIQGESVKLQVWDSAGQDQYFAISKITIKKVHGIVLVYDTTKEETFRLVRKWLERTQ